MTTAAADAGVSPLVSVVLPVHNGEGTVREAVESVLGQTYSHLELIVVNDGSTDSTLDVLSKIKDPRMRICSFPNAGPSAGRNRGIALASGAYLAFIDADDLWLPDKLAAQLAALRQDSQAGVAYGWTDFVGATGKFVHSDRRVTFNGDVYRRMLIHNFIDSGSNIMVRKEALDDVGRFDESLPTVEDWDLYIRLAVRYPFVCVPKVLVRYRLSPTSLTNQILVMEESYWRVINRAFAAAPAPLQRLKPKSVALVYEYLTTKATQGWLSRRNGLTAIRFFCAAVRSRPASLLHLWRKPWLLKALAKACLSILLPARVLQKFILVP